MALHVLVHSCLAYAMNTGGCSTLPVRSPQAFRARESRKWCTSHALLAKKTAELILTLMELRFEGAGKNGAAHQKEATKFDGITVACK